MPAMDDVPLSKPDITDREIELVTQVLRSDRLSIGPMVERFEHLLASRCNRGHGVACSSGTAGLHMALIAAGVGPGDEVITTPFSFIAPANAVLYVGAKPIFAEICPKSLNMDPVKVEAAITPKTKAIIAVENFGNPQHMDEYRKIADRNEIKLIEDCCEAIGGRYQGRAVGDFGHYAVFGFYPNKQITTGEGGMVLTNDDRGAEVLRSLRNQGRATPGTSGLGNWMQFERLGYNYRMSEIQAALGVAQLERLDEILEARRTVANRYIERFMGLSEVVLPNISDETTMSWFVFVLRLNDQYTGVERDRIVQGLHRHDVGSAAYFPAIHIQPHFQALGFRQGDFPITESVSERTLALPFYTSLSARDADFAASTFELMIARENLSRRDG
ncbi:DegT/DnrJ/EryC1/StrS family aminotransferase [Phycisphaerales bacterium ac7]|nr:DegT/DnrJ/EryC1/StrS family aminotransferase [bacterium]